MSDEERERDSSPPDDTVVASEDDGEEEWSPFDEIQDDFKPRPIPKVTAADGLPTNFAPVVESDIPELSPETLVCMGRYDKFVVRGQFGDIIASFEPEDVKRAPDGSWRVPLAMMEDRLKLSIERLANFIEKLDPHNEHQVMPKNHTVRVRALLVAFGYRVTPDWAEVMPIRPPCAHYARQLSQFDLNAQAQVMLRVCAARRTTEGAFMSLRDRAMWACELRMPADAASNESLDAFDEKKMQQGKSRELFPIFQDSGLGVFGGNNG